MDGGVLSDFTATTVKEECNIASFHLNGQIYIYIQSVDSYLYPQTFSKRQMLENCVPMLILSAIFYFCLDFSPMMNTRFSFYLI